MDKVEQHIVICQWRADQAEANNNLICDTLTNHYYFSIIEFNNYSFIIWSPSLFFSEYLQDKAKQYAMFRQCRNAWFHLCRSKILFIYLFIYYLVRTSTAKAGEILNFVMQTKYRPFLLIKIKLTPSTFWNRHTYGELTPPWPFIQHFSSHWYYPSRQSTVKSNRIRSDNHT